MHHHRDLSLGLGSRPPLPWRDRVCRDSMGQDGVARQLVAGIPARGGCATPQRRRGSALWAGAGLEEGGAETCSTPCRDEQQSKKKEGENNEHESRESEATKMGGGEILDQPA